MEPIIESTIEPRFEPTIGPRIERRNNRPEIGAVK